VALIPIKVRYAQPSEHSFQIATGKSQQEGIDMPFDAAMCSLAVTVVFAAFAGVLAWADFRTRSPHAEEPTRKRRAF
jgi:hypothetical protein